ncbi:MAG: hypothetical protein H6713_18245 [Myxococcales bacterium]|nr:hypothetical protein [Myxococcales bacterium]MCB9751919.1 hypothetical protein [Myxococcales bacterium]
MDSFTRTVQHCFLLTLLALAAAGTTPLGAYFQITGSLTALFAITVAVLRWRGLEFHELGDGPGVRDALERVSSRGDLPAMVYLLLMLASIAWLTGVMFVVLS